MKRLLWKMELLSCLLELGDVRMSKVLEMYV